MKKIINIIIIIGLIIGTSCNKQLDLKPHQSIDANDALTSSQNVQNALIGAYEYMRRSNTFAGAFVEYSEYLATTNNGRYIGTWGSHTNLASKVITVDNTQVRDSWIDAYYDIGIVNNILTAINVLEPELQDEIEGQALIIRGWTLFELTRLYAHTYQPGATNSQDGVPIILLPAMEAEDAELVSRNTVEECYTQAIEDLSNAKALLGDESNPAILNSFAASAILSRIYLQQGRYSEAAQEANRVIEEGSYSLMDSPLDVFNIDGFVNEHIFGFKANTSSNAARLPVIFGSMIDGGRGDYEILQNWINGFEAGDLRGQIQTDDVSNYESLNEMYYIGVGDIVNDGGINTSKWGNYYNTVPMIRLAEMYLTRAEANFMAGAQIGTNTPLQDINVIRDRSGLADAAAISLALIQDERLKELCWEGHRLHDMKRWRIDIGALPYNDNSLVLPIPYREREANPNLTQNPGYVE